MRTRGVLAVLLVAAAATAMACGAEGRDRAAGDGGRLLEGGADVFRSKVRELRGRPIVVNQWASWCGPCRAEFPFFQRLAGRYRGRVAFLGVNSMDSNDDAIDFLRRYPTPFPHFADPDAKVARVFRGGRSWPTTAFYTAQGDLAFVHQGAYRSEGDLETAIRRYALDG